MDSVDTFPTNPILVSSTPTLNLGGISINANLDSIAGPETMYFVAVSDPYYYWNGSGWTNTYHTSGAFYAVNPGGTANYIYSLDGIGNSLYRYDGTGNGTLLLSNLNSVAIADIATDNMGNFYIYFINQEIVVFNSSGMAIDTFSTSGITPNGGGGFSILGDNIYVITTSDLYKGIKTGNNINFTLIKNVGFNVGDMATCPEAGNPITATFNISSLNSIVYPNPCLNELNIRIDSDEKYEVIIFDLMSKKLLQHTFSVKITLNTETLAKGIYLYEIREKNIVVKKGKVVRE
jgi:hypothetical protein